MNRQDGLRIAAGLFILAGLAWTASAFMGDGGASPAIGAMFIALSAVFAALTRKRGGS